MNMRERLAFVSKTHNKLAVGKLAKTLSTLHNTKYKFRREGDFIEIARFKNTSVNKSLVSEYEQEFNENHATFPKYLTLCMCKGNKKDLFLCVYYENCCPNWNNERHLLKVIPMSEVNCKVVENISDIVSVNTDIYEELLNIESKRIGKDLPDYGELPDKEQLKDLINKGMRCVYRRGWAYRGAKAIDITSSEALAKLPHYDYGKGFQMLSYNVKGDIPKLEFNEVSTLDME